MALPDYDGIDPIGDEAAIYIDGAGVGAWGGTKSPYVANAIGVLAESDPARQRFNHNVALRQQEATTRVEKYTPLASDVFPEPVYKSIMTDRSAERIVSHALSRPIDYLGSDYVLFAVQQLGEGHALYTRWKGCVTQTLAGETEIRDTAIDYITSLPIAP